MRTCGDCQICCKLLPISEIGKAASKRCAHQKFGVGCKVHGTPRQPRSCRLWSCWWLMNPAFDLPRPDRAGYVVDPTQDFVVLGEDVFTGRQLPALQIWADPSRPDAWRSALPWIKDALAGKPSVALIRFNSRDAIVIVPPNISETGDWLEIDPRVMKPVTADALRFETIQRAVSSVQVQEGESSS